MSELFSERLAVAIAKSGKSKGSLAKHCEVALSTVSRWMKGSIPKADTVVEIAKFLGVNAKWLLSGSGQAMLTTDDMESLLRDPKFKKAYLAASKERRQQHTDRVRRLVCESCFSFEERLGKHLAETREFYSDLEKLFELTREDYPIDSHEDRLALCRQKAESLAAQSAKIFGDHQELIEASLALRNLAETSPTTLEILREAGMNYMDH